MSTAYLDCVNKRIQFAIGEENFTVDLEGKEIEFGRLRTKLGDFQIRFSWNYEMPQFSIVSDKQYFGELPKGDLNLLLSNWDYYKISILVGDKEDYFGVKFPNGFKVWYETYYQISNCFIAEKLTDIVPDTMYHAHLIRDWTNEFENKNVGREWDGEFIDEVIEFVKLKKKKL